MTAPDRIFAFDYDQQAESGEWQTRHSWSETNPAPIKATEYIRADIATPAALSLEVAALVDLLKEAKLMVNYNTLAGKLWHDATDAALRGIGGGNG